MEVIILGSGTSTGVPVLGCDCEVCVSQNPRNQRTRVSCIVETAGKRLIIDTSPDLRAQCLREGIFAVDAILYTHAHADHANGVDDCRLFNFNNGYREIPAYASPATAETLLARFGYAFGLSSYPGAPKLRMHPVQDTFRAAGVEVTAVPVPHGPAGEVFGFRVGDYAYVTDCNDVPPEAMEKLRGLEVLVLDGLRKKTHPTHLHLDRSLEIIAELAPKRAWLTHVSHDLDIERDGPDLPDGVEFAYDGLRITIED